MRRRPDKAGVEQVPNAKKTGRFEPGRSGNPSGRRRGEVKLARLRAGLAECLPAVLQVLQERALGGDLVAVRLILERTLPQLKPAEQCVPLPGMAGTLHQQAEAVTEAISSGVLPPSQGAHLLQAVAALAKLLDIDFEARLQALEGEKNEERS